MHYNFLIQNTLERHPVEFPGKNRIENTYLLVYTLRLQDSNRLKKFQTFYFSAFSVSGGVNACCNMEKEDVQQALGYAAWLTQEEVHTVSYSGTTHKG